MTASEPASIQPTPTGVESPTDHAPAAADSGDRAITLGRHVRFTQVELRDQTDRVNELVHTRSWLLHTSEKLDLVGNLFVEHDLETGRGRVFLKAAPLPHARPVPEASDIAVRPAGTGYELVLKSDGHYPWHVIEYTGGDFQRTAALQRFQRDQLRHEPWFITNTWGDRNRDGRLGHDFVLAEIDAAADLGADLLQIDDGWQRGRSSNSVEATAAGGVWEGFHDALPDFWTPDPVRFPHGLDPVIEAAKQRGLLLGLWYAPDSANDFANHERDAQTMVDLHRRFGVRSFKLDSIDIRSRTGEQRVRQMIEAVHRGTAGKVVLDLDITAGRRPGYFGMIEAGPLFVENRYTDWRRYWPHQTLRSLWSLSPWIDPARLRFEFLNHARNAEAYGDDPLAPARYTPAALFASVMFACPLGWFECSGLPPAYREQIAPLAATWKAHRDELFAGTIVGVGDTPDGFGWTGLASIRPDHDAAYLMLFRGLHAPADRVSRLPGGLIPQHVEVLAGDGSASAVDGELRVRVDPPRGYLWLRIGLR